VWLKIDDRIVDHPKMFAAARHLGRRGHARAFGVYMAGLCYANGHLTDGFLAESVVLGFKIDTKPTEVAAVLAFPEIQLWEVVAGGWRIHDYHQFNPKAADVKEKLAADRDRKREERAAKEAAKNGGRRGRSGSDRSPIDHESVANRSEIDRGFAFLSSVTDFDRSAETVDSIEHEAACPDGLRPDSAALARARSRPDPDPVRTGDEDHAALRTANGGNPVENPRRARREPVEAVKVLRALIWREVAALADCGPLDPGDVLEHLKCTAARAGLIYGLDDFHEQAALAIDRFSANVGRVDANRNAWRAGERARVRR
jgi:hypothetical protein